METLNAEDLPERVAALLDEDDLYTGKARYLGTYEGLDVYEPEEVAGDGIPCTGYPLYILDDREAQEARYADPDESLELMTLSENFTAAAYHRD